MPEHISFQPRTEDAISLTTSQAGKRLRLPLDLLDDVSKRLQFLCLLLVVVSVAGAIVSELDKKVTQVLAGKVVRKDLVRKVKVGAPVPVSSSSTCSGSTARPTTRPQSTPAFGSSTQRSLRTSFAPKRPTRSNHWSARRAATPSSTR